MYRNIVLPPLPSNPTQEQIDAQLILIKQQLDIIEIESIPEWEKC